MLYDTIHNPPDLLSICCFFSLCDLAFWASDFLLLLLLLHRFLCLSLVRPILSPLHPNSSNLCPPSAPRCVPSRSVARGLYSAKSTRNSCSSSLNVRSTVARLPKPLAPSILDVPVAPHTLVHALRFQLRGSKYGQHLRWEWPGTRSALTPLIARPPAV